MPLDLQFTGLLLYEARIHIEEQTMSEALLRYTPYDLATDHPLGVFSNPLFYHGCRNAVVAPVLCRDFIAGAKLHIQISHQQLSNRLNIPHSASEHQTGTECRDILISGLRASYHILSHRNAHTM